MQQEPAENVDTKPPKRPPWWLLAAAAPGLLVAGILSCGEVVDDTESELVTSATTSTSSAYNNANDTTRAGIDSLTNQALTNTRMYNVLVARTEGPTGGLTWGDFDCLRDGKIVFGNAIGSDYYQFTHGGCDSTPQNIGYGIVTMTTVTTSTTSGALMAKSKSGNDVTIDTQTEYGMGQVCNHRSFPNNYGTSQTNTSDGQCVDLKGTFFTAFTGNGRSCASCHKPDTDWTITPPQIARIFDITDGQDPVFRTNDGSNSPNADVSTVAARRIAYGQLLKYANIRVGIGQPGVDVSVATEVGNTATYTTVAAHGFSVGESVDVTGVGVAGYNATVTVASVPNATTFTATLAASGLTSSSGGNAVTAKGFHANREFDVVAVSDPYGYASSKELSLFRRPLPASRTKYHSGVMWDGRESNPASGTKALTRYDGTLSPNNVDQPRLDDVTFDLQDQSNGATKGHAEFSPGLTLAQRQDIVNNFELKVFTAQDKDNGAGPLYKPAQGAYGGPGPLTTANYWLPNSSPDNTQFRAGINDPLGLDPCRESAICPGGHGFTFTVFQNYSSSWAGTDANRLSILRGQQLFNNINPANGQGSGFTIQIADVPGLNGPADRLGLPNPLAGGCATCHDAPNLGHHSIATTTPANSVCGTVACSSTLDIGLSSHPTVNTRPDMVNPDFPMYTLQCNATGIAHGACTSGQQIQTTDPGRALVSGRWDSISRQRGPQLRNAASREPLFHGGQADTIDTAVAFYVGGCFNSTGGRAARLDDGTGCPSGYSFKRRFDVTRNGVAYLPTRQDEADLAAFIKAL